MKLAAPDAPLTLLGARDLDAPLAWNHGRPISGHAFLADAQALAAQLPAQGAAVNLCAERYHFAVGLAGALWRSRPSLLPADTRPDTLQRLQSAYPDTFALVDGDTVVGVPGMERIAVSAEGTLSARSVGVPAIEPGQHAASLLTSGSTGTPQPHGKSWQTLHGNVAAAAARLASLLGRPSLEGLNLVATVPAQHSYGFESTVLLALLGGAAFDSGRPFYPADIAEALASVPRPRALVTTPFHLKTLLASGVALPPIDLILSATAPLSPQLAARAEQLAGGMLVEIYGCTEAGQVATRRSTASEWWDTFGTLRIAASATSDTEGAPVFTVQGGHVECPTALADILELRDERTFRLLGRSNDLIHVAGKRSSLGHLDFHLNSIPGVDDGAFWLPDEVEDGVVRPVALVVAPTLSAQAVIAELRTRLEAAFVPRRVLHVPSLPRVATGKLTAHALAALARGLLAPASQSPTAAVTETTMPTSLQVLHTVPADHPVFEGHFAGEPLLPGALLLAEVLERVRARPMLSAHLGAAPTLASAKFLAPVRPGAVLTIDLKPTGEGDKAAIDFEVRFGTTVAARGRWVRGAGTASESSAR